MDFNFAEFIMGLNDALTKQAEEGSIFDISGSVFPNVTSQSKWQFARTNEHLHLNDGQRVYCFHLPEGEKEEDFPIKKLDDVCFHEFGKDHVNKGTVQVHRSDPGSIYFTMQDGHKNPTYTFKHVNGTDWRAIPKVKAPNTTAQIDAEAFVKGAQDMLHEDGAAGKILSTLLGGVDAAGRGAVRGTMALGHDPLLSAGAGLMGGIGYDVAKRSLYNSKEENEAETAGDRLKRYLLPTAVMGLTGAAAKGAFPNYYSEFPLHRP